MTIEEAIKHDEEMAEAIEEAIKHDEEMVEEQDMKAGFETDYLCYQMSDTERNQYKECAEEYRQLAEWLKELKRLKDQKSCEDCISREAVLAIAGDSCLDLDSYEDAKEFCDEIKELPPVTPQPKMGRWIDEGFYAEGHSEHAYRCSECDEHYIGYVGEFKHCPNCGATMQKYDREDNE